MEMKLPKDPVTLLSFVNTHLRDRYPSLQEFCEAYDADPGELMEKLQEIARDCQKVRNYVYTRYSGIGSLGKLYPGYTIQNEMTKDGLRQELGLPSVYFYLAMFDALKDIKSQWTRTKNRVLRLVGQNDGFSEEEKH